MKNRRSVKDAAWPHDERVDAVRDIAGGSLVELKGAIRTHSYCVDVLIPVLKNSAA